MLNRSDRPVTCVGGKVATFNADAARAVPGVRNVLASAERRAVIADGFWPAKLGRDKLEINGTKGLTANLSTVGMRSNKQLGAETGKGGFSRKSAIRRTLSLVRPRPISAEYEVPLSGSRDDGAFGTA